jgi:hypothetical protein
VPPAIIIPDPDGWVIVDPTATNGALSGALIRFLSVTAVPGGAATDPGDVAGSGPATPKSGTTLRIVFQAEPVTGPSVGSPTLSNELSKILINNWAEVSLLDLQQFGLPGANCCTPLTTDLGIDYTADHELLHSWAISITSCASGLGWSPTPPPLPAKRRPVTPPQLPCRMPRKWQMSGGEHVGGLYQHRGWRDRVSRLFRRS